MAELHYFYPENDVALGWNTPNYTAPAAAVSLRQSGSTLAMWTGRAGDRFVTDGVNENWYDAMAEAFGIEVLPFAGDISDLQPAPWGWSLPVRRTFQRLGYQSEMLPSDSDIARLRMLSHRSTALQLSRFFGGRGIAAESAEEALDAVHAFGRAMLKLPWSSSGRGVFDSSELTDAEILRRATGTIRRQGGIVVEPYIPDAYDFALLFTMSNGHAVYDGLSLFETDAHNAFLRSIVAEEEKLQEIFLHDTSLKVSVIMGTTAEGLEEVLGDGYSGPLSVDMLATRDGKVYVAEINLRHTMGRVAAAFASRFLAAGRRATFSIQPNKPVFAGKFSVADTAKVVSRKLEYGSISLSPTDAPMRFDVSVVE